MPCRSCGAVGTPEGLFHEPAYDAEKKKLAEENAELKVKVQVQEEQLCLVRNFLFNILQEVDTHLTNEFRHKWRDDLVRETEYHLEHRIIERNLRVKELIEDIEKCKSDIDKVTSLGGSVEGSELQMKYDKLINELERVTNLTDVELVFDRTCEKEK